MNCHCNFFFRVFYLEQLLVEFGFLQHEPIVGDIQLKLHNRCVGVHRLRMQHKQHYAMESICLELIRLHDEHGQQIVVHLIRKRVKF